MTDKEISDAVWNKIRDQFHLAIFDKINITNYYEHYSWDNPIYTGITRPIIFQIKSQIGFELSNKIIKESV